MIMRFVYHIKFEGNPHVQIFKFNNMEEMFHTLREYSIREPQRYGIIQWMIRD